MLPIKYFLFPDRILNDRASRLGEEIRNLETTMEAADGRKVPVLVYASPIRDRAGRIVAAINTWLDISERKQVEQTLQTYASKLEHANRALRDLTIAASHDLQEPLRKIEVFGDAVLQGSTDLQPQQRDHLSRMRKSTRQMRDMVYGLRELALLPTDVQAFEPVDLGEIARQVLFSLAEQIFQPFKRLVGKDQTNYPGTGIGLTMCRWIVEFMVERSRLVAY